jgi:phosphoserine phosphatase
LLWGLACELDVLLHVFLSFCLVSTCCSECRSSKEDPSLYPEAKGVLSALRQKGVTMAVASRTPTPDIARCFLNKLNITDYFVNMVSVRCPLRRSFFTVFEVSV